VNTVNIVNPLKTAEKSARTTTTACTAGTASAAPDANRAPAGAAVPAGPGPGTSPRRTSRDADGMAVASFLLGLPGLLVLNLVLGPAAIVLALTALARGTTRRGRALLGFVLGVADLVVMVALTVADHGVIWSFS
jgi:hypothetical protein